MLFGRTMLGLDPRDGRPVLNPTIPEPIGRIKLTGSKAFGTRWELEATGTQSDVRLAP